MVQTIEAAIFVTEGRNGKMYHIHKCYVKGKGWCSFSPEQTIKNYGIETKQLETSDLCLTVKGNKLRKVKIVGLVPFKESIKTYNLTKIANSNNYFVNGILVNNESATK